MRLLKPQDVVRDFIVLGEEDGKVTVGKGKAY